MKSIVYCLVLSACASGPCYKSSLKGFETDCGPYAYSDQERKDTVDGWIARDRALLSLAPEERTVVLDTANAGMHLQQSYDQGILENERRFQDAQRAVFNRLQDNIAPPYQPLTRKPICIAYPTGIICN